MITPGKDAYLETREGKIRIYLLPEHAGLMRSVTTVKKYVRDEFWHMIASATSAETLGNVLGHLDVECDEGFMALYELSQQAESAREMRTREDIQDHPSRTSSWLHQRQAYQMGYPLQGFGLWADMGTGKSKVVVDLIANRGHRLVLIVGPKKATRIWTRQFRDHSLATDTEVVILNAPRQKTTIAEQARIILDRREDSKDHPMVFVTNYQAFNSVSSEPLVEAVMSTQWDLVVADEAHHLCSPKARVSKVFARFPKFVPFRIGMSGTPEKKGPLDIWGIYRFLDPSIFPSSFYRFRDQYAIMDRMFPNKVVSYHDLDDFAERMYSIAFRVTADVLDLPEYHHVYREVALSPAAMRLHDSMHNDLISTTDEGSAVAENVLTKMLRMQQITGGHITVQDDYGTDVVTRADFAKLDELGAILEETPDLPREDLNQDPTPEPVVVFCRFVAELDDVRELCEGMGRRYGELSGRRDDLNEDGQMPEGIDVLGVQIQAGGVGVDLTRARYAVYFSKGYSLVDYEQSLKRLHRPGQTRPVTYYHLIATGTIDTHVENAIAEKVDIVDYVWREALRS